MTPERWQAIKEVLHQALQLEPHDRPEFLDRACSGDLSLRRQVEDLLAEEVSSGFLEPPDPQPDAEEAAAKLEDVDDLHLVGSTISNYHVLRKLGRGGMGVVYEAEDLKLRRHVALKFLSQELADDSTALRRFGREAQAASALNHPSICTIYGVEEHDGRPVIAMELLDGQSLTERLRSGPLSTDELLTFSIQAFDALAAAHAKGIIHRDIKPGNIFVVAGERVKILDFGLAKALPSRTPAVEVDEESLTADGVIPGTTAYMSPEQIQGEEIDGRSDEFSLGVVLYEAATSKRPFEGKNRVLLMGAILRAEPVPPSRRNSALPASLDTVILKLLEKDPALRYQHAADACSDLKRLQREVESGQPAVAAAPTVMRPNRRLGTWTLALSAVALALAFVAGAFYRFHRARALTEKDTIVLADFDNKTGDAVFDDTLKQALAVHLDQSPFIDLLSGEKVNATLQLMGRQPGERLTAPVARDLCQRVGGKALLAGSITTLGSQYVIGLRAINCSTGDSLAEEQTQASGKEQVLKAVGEAANALRSKLGESLVSVQKYDTPLEQATTSSLEALKAYSAGWKALLQGDAAALPLYKRAIDLDPNFALAYSQLAIPYSNMGESTRAAAAARRAFELRDRVSEREKFRISAYYYFFVTGELQKSQEVYELWRQAYPHDLIPYVELTNNCMVAGQWEQALPPARQALAVDEGNIFVWFNLGSIYFALNRPEEARATLDQALARKLDGSFLHFLRYYSAFLDGDFQVMNEQASWTGEGHDLLLSAHSDTEAYFGRLATARQFSERAVDTALAADAKETAALWQVNAALHDAELGRSTSGAHQAHAALALSSGSFIKALAALALARSGHTAEAHQLAVALDHDFPQNTMLQNYWLPAIRAAIELVRDNADAAVELLRPTTDYELSQSQPFVLGMMYPPYLRGEAYLHRKKGAEAAAEFRKVIDHRGVMLNYPLGSLARLGLARAYALQGDTAKARSAYNEFLSLWKEADTDIPILRHAKAERAKLK